MPQQTALATDAHADNKIFMSGIEPQYWGNKQIDNIFPISPPYTGYDPSTLYFDPQTNDAYYTRYWRQYAEYHGGLGLTLQWQSTMQQQQADWVLH